MSSNPTASNLAIQNNCSYITVLSTDSYLEGVIVLYHSLMRTQPKYPFLVLTTPNLSDLTYQTLNQHGIHYRPIEPIKLDTTIHAAEQHWEWSYSKLQIFNQAQFDKLVYLDADMLICENIDELFAKPHMSAVNAGGMLPENATWTQLNSGLMVIEPSFSLYDDMMSRLSSLYNPAGGDQDVIQAYYPDWPDRPELHLDHGYNIFHTHLDRYQQLFDYRIKSQTNPVKVIHFIGEHKPWLIKSEITQHQTSKRKVITLTSKDFAKRLFRSIKKRSPHSLRQRLPNASGCKLKRLALQAWLECYQTIPGSH
jgi:hypothetical protein